MASSRNNSFLAFQDPDDFKRLRDVFETAGFNDAEIFKALQIDGINSIRGTDIPFLLHRTEDLTPLNTLVRLFLIEVPCNVTAVQQAFRPLQIEKLVEAGIVQIDNSLVTASIKLQPFKDLLTAFDLPRMLQTGLKKDYVMGVGSSTLTLANLTIRRQADTALDLGTGCGIHALLAARHSNRVLAVDLNPRAVQMAAFNTKLNGLPNIECLEGDLFGPVREQKFDLIITNPPFVISPEMKYIYRDSGLGADQICRKIVHQAPRYLNEGGFCHILCNWAEKTGQDWQDRMHGWFEDTGCDVWVLRSETRDAATYASTWIQHTEKDGQGQNTESLKKWMDYYDKQGIDAMSAGLITMRRSSSHANWYRADDAPPQMLSPCGDHVMRGFQLQDFLKTVNDDPALLNARLRVSPDVRLERSARPSVEGWVDEKVQLALTQGLTYSGNVDTHMANMIVKCDGRKPLNDMLTEMAHSLSADPAKITPTFCKLVRNLVERGFLLPHDLEI